MTILWQESLFSLAFRFTQGLYISHMTSQPECMVFQMAECLVIGTGVAVILKNKQEYIILRKWKAEYMNIELDNVSKNFKNQTVLENVNLKIGIWENIWSCWKKR